MAPLLSVEGLKVRFRTHAGEVPALEDVSLSVNAGGVLGVVGESGCGKSVTALSIMRLIPSPPGRIAGGRIVPEGRGNLLEKSEAEMRSIRGDAISMIFQEPMTSLNPVFRVGAQIAETLRLHRGLDRAQAREGAVEMLDRVGIPSAAQRAEAYPHQLSGGMRQRVMIAMAMACRPRLLLADEPTTALDVTVQAQILELMNRMREAEGASILLITHDMGVIAEMATTVVVMYAGVVVEEAEVRALFARPLHPYTQGLLASIPRGRGRGGALTPIPGLVPSLLNLPKGCRFRDRCPLAMAKCAEAEPPLAEIGEDGGRLRRVRCWLHAPAAAAA